MCNRVNTGLAAVASEQPGAAGLGDQARVAKAILPEEGRHPNAPIGRA